MRDVYTWEGAGEQVGAVGVFCGTCSHAVSVEARCCSSASENVTLMCALSVCASSERVAASIPGVLWRFSFFR
jgi:hypothetical protein